MSVFVETERGDWINLDHVARVSPARKCVAIPPSAGVGVKLVPVGWSLYGANGDVLGITTLFPVPSDDQFTPRRPAVPWHQKLAAAKEKTAPAQEPATGAV